MRLFFLAIIIFFSPSGVYALNVCKCPSEVRTIEENIKRSFAVFTGTVIDISRKFKPDRHEIRFNVHKSWKGAKNDTILVYSSGTDVVAFIREGITCGYNFQEGETYLVYSYRKRSRRGPSFVNRCSDTKKFKNAEEDIEILGEPILIFEE